MDVLQHDLFNDVVLLGGELDRPRRNWLFIVGWGLGNGTADQRPGERYSQGCSLHNRPNPIPTLDGVSRDNHDGAVAVPSGYEGGSTVLSGRQGRSPDD